MCGKEGMVVGGGRLGAEDDFAEGHDVEVLGQLPQQRDLPHRVLVEALRAGSRCTSQGHGTCKWRWRAKSPWLLVSRVLPLRALVEALRAASRGGTPRSVPGLRAERCPPRCRVAGAEMPEARLRARVQGRERERPKSPKARVGRGAGRP